MTDKLFQKLLNRLSSANLKYKALLDLAEEEYKARYGLYPSEHDNDEWIDSFHQGCGTMTVEEVKKFATLHGIERRN